MSRPCFGEPSDGTGSSGTRGYAPTLCPRGRGGKRRRRCHGTPAAQPVRSSAPGGGFRGCLLAMAVPEHPHGLTAVHDPGLGSADQRGVLVDAEHGHPLRSPQERARDDVRDPAEHPVEVRDHPQVGEQTEAGVGVTPEVAHGGDPAGERHRSRAAAGERRPAPPGGLDRGPDRGPAKGLGEELGVASGQVDQSCAGDEAGQVRASRHCQRCKPQSRARWTRELVRGAHRFWRERFGFIASSVDWSRTHAQRRGGDALTRYQSAHWPSQSVIRRLYTTPAAARADAFPAP